MKKLIRWSLNHIPRPVLQRIAGWAVPAAGLFYKGRGVECPVCGAKYRKFMPYGYVQPRPNALCPKCLSLERHRLLWLYLTRETDLLTAFPRTLHIAPEVCIMRHLKPHFRPHPGQYVTADLESPLADIHFDVQQIPLADDSVDVVICNHILEHVADDRKALRELHRILKPGGWGIVLSPVDTGITNRPTRTIRSPTPTSARASSGSTTTGASTAPTMPTVCARRASKPPTSTTPRPSPTRSAGYTPCPPILFTWFTKSDRRPSKRLSAGNRPTAMRGLVLPWKSLPQVIKVPFERTSEVK